MSGIDRAALEDLFAPLFPVGIRRMFGGLGLYRDNLIFAIVIEGILYFKADEKNREAFQSSGGQPFVYEARGKPITVSYWTAPELIFDDVDALRAWTQLALDASLRAQHKKG